MNRPRPSTAAAKVIDPDARPLSRFLGPDTMVIDLLSRREKGAWASNYAAGFLIHHFGNVLPGLRSYRTDDRFFASLCVNLEEINATFARNHFAKGAINRVAYHLDRHATSGDRLVFRKPAIAAD